MRLEGDIAPEDFRTVIAGHSDRRDLLRDPVDLKFNRSGYIHGSVRYINRLLRQRGEFSEEPAVHGNHLMRLLAGLRQLSGNFYISAIAIKSPERITWERSWLAVCPS